MSRPKQKSAIEIYRRRKREEGRGKKEEAIKSMVWAINNVNPRRGHGIAVSPD